MSMLDIPLEQIDEAALNRLIDLKIRESQTIDYKRETYGNGDKDRSEFLADVSSFANTMGGDPQPSPHFESPVNCNRRLAFLLIDARYASPAACECSNAIVVSKAAGRQFVLFARLFPDRGEKTAPNSGPLKNEGIHEVATS